MTRILITGMSASQTSVNANKRSLSFAGVIEKALTETGSQVIMLEPDITWERENLDYYDVVLVGVSPLTSLSAHYAYGALHVINLLKGSDKLRLFIDAPNPAQISASLRAITAWPDNLVKPFYSNRRGHSLASQDNTRNALMQAVTLLDKETWPTTIFPHLPWGDKKAVSADLPKGAQNSLHGVNLDSFLLKRPNDPLEDRTARWAADNPDSTWTKKILATLRYPAMPMKWNKGWSDLQVEEQVRQCVGALITPHKNTTWWTYRYAQAMNTATPIATEWKESCVVSHHWAYLASTIEDMSPKQRIDLSLEQSRTYLAAVGSKKDAVDYLHGLIISKEGAAHAV